jgi:hypothetical protein
MVCTLHCERGFSGAFFDVSVGGLRARKFGPLGRIRQGVWENVWNFVDLHEIEKFL